MCGDVMRTGPWEIENIDTEETGIVEIGSGFGRLSIMRETTTRSSYSMKVTLGSSNIWPS